jgi:UDP-glucose 4-epimerase
MSTTTGTTTRRKKQHRTVAITGVHGFLGSRLLRQLEEDRRYHRIIVLDVVPLNQASRKCQYYYVDLTEPGMDKTVADILRKEQVDTIVHVAFHSSPQRDERTSHELTVIGTMNVIKACRRVSVRKLVVQSTTLVYGADHRNPSLMEEQTPLNGARSYGFIRDKVEVENMLRKLVRSAPEMIVTSLRLCPILSPHHSDYITGYLERSVVLTTMGYDPLVQFLHEEDAIVALKKAVDKDHPGAINIVGRGVMYLSTVMQLAKRTAVPVLSPLASPLVDAMWYLKISEAPGPHVDYLRFSCIASGERAEKEMGFVATHTTKQTLLDYLGHHS